MLHLTEISSASLSFSMDSKVCVASLILLAHLSTAHGAVIPSEAGRVFQKVQDVLANADTFATALGMRVKRDTADWDKELDMEAFGLSFKIKYVDPSNPFLGGRAFLKFPGHHFVRTANVDDVELKLDFNGSIDQFNMKIEYKIVQKFSLFADQPQKGVLTVSAVTNHRSKSNLKKSLERNGEKVFEMNADGEINVVECCIKLHGQVIFEHNNVWEMFIDLSSKSINIRFIQNGLEYSVAANAFSVFEWSWIFLFGDIIPSHLLKVGIQIAYPGHRYSFQVEYSVLYGPYIFMVKTAGDFRGPFGFEASLSVKSKTLLGKLWLYNGNKTYIDLVGDFTKENDSSKWKYVATYSFMDGWPQFKTEGKAIINFDGFNGILTDSKIDYTLTIIIDYTELNGKKGYINIDIEPQDSGLKYLMDITHDGKKILKQEGVGSINTTDSEVWETTNVVKTEADETSPFHKLHCYYMYPVPCTTSIKTTRKYAIHRQSKFKYEEETLHGAEKFSSLKIDTTSTPISFTWEVDKAPDFYPFEGKIDWTAEDKTAPTKSMFNSHQLRVNSTFKFEKDGKTIFWQNVDCTFWELGVDNVTLDYELDEDFYKLNKWFGSLIHPIPQWKKGSVKFNTYIHSILKVQLDSLNYEFMLNYPNIKVYIPVAPEWYPLEGEFDLITDWDVGRGWVNTTFTYKHGGKTFWEGQHDFLIDITRQSLKFKTRSKIALNENSLIYAKLCGEDYSGNCSNVYELEKRFYIDSRNTTMDLYLEGKKDGENFLLFKIDAMNKPFQLVWSQPKRTTGILKTMLGLERLEVTADYEAQKELIVISNLAEMNLILRKEPNLFMEFKRYGETYLKFNHQKDQDQLSIDTVANLYIPSGSIYCVQQSYFEGCYNKWFGEIKVFVDFKNKNVYLNKHSINAVVKKDMEVIFELEPSTNVSPYVLKIKAPHLMDKLFDVPHKQSLDLTVDHQEGKLLHIQTNHPTINSFKINDLNKLELNGNGIGDYKISDKQLTVTYQLPDGEKINLQVVCSGWNQWMNPKNQGSLKIETPAAKFNLDVDYDVTDVKNGQMMVNVHGENLKFGKYEFVRKANWHLSNSMVVIAWDGKAQFERGQLAMFSPIDTKAHVDYDVTNMVLTANIDKDIVGQKWSFQVTDNKVSISSQ